MSSTSLLDRPEVSGQYFFPRRSRLPGAWWVETPEARLSCWLETVDPRRPTLIHFHGNGEVVGDYLPQLAEQFVDTGVNLLLAEYRGYGESTGRPAAVAMLDDVERIFERLGSPPERVIAFGRSIGSLYAVELARRVPTLAGLVLESGIADPFERFLLYADLESGVDTGELERETNRHFNQRAKLGAYVNPLLVMHTRDDTLIDMSHAERLYAWGGGEDKELVLFPEGGHNGILHENAGEYFASLRRFVARAIM